MSIKPVLNDYYFAKSEFSGLMKHAIYQIIYVGHRGFTFQNYLTQSLHPMLNVSQIDVIRIPIPTTELYTLDDVRKHYPEYFI